MPHIWRVEDNEGIGCYRSLDIRSKEVLELDSQHTDSTLYPMPCDDKGIDRHMKSEEICGFISEEQAKEWFNEVELRYLALDGLPLKRLEVKEITAIGKKQVLAIR